MQRVPMAEFAPELQKRLEVLWGKPVDLYRALGNQPALVAAWTEFFNALRHESRTPRPLREIMLDALGVELDAHELDYAPKLS